MLGPSGVVGLIFALGLLVRIAHVLQLPEVHYDEAGTGLMARHVLRGDFPMFYWGEDYGGTLESFLTAVSFALFGSSPVTLRLVPLGFSLLLMPLSYRLAQEVFAAPTPR